MTVEATITVDFNGASGLDYIAFVQLADDYNLDAGGELKTSFYPGDDIYIEHNHSSNIKLVQIVSTFGSISSLGTRSGIMTVQRLFSGRESGNETEYAFPVTGKSSSVAYYGRPGKLTTNKLGFNMYSVSGDYRVAPFFAEFNINYVYGLTRLKTPTIALEEDEKFPISIVYYFEEV